MSQVRPKRKATINKSYNDSTELPQDYDLSSSSSVSSINSIATNTTTTTRKRNQKRPSPQIENGTNNHNNNNTSTSTPSKSIIPYNWQPPPNPDNAFSHRLDLNDAYIDLELQTLYCPNQFIIPKELPQDTRKKKSKQVFTLSKGEYIYMVSEPPGEPYYIGRIMGFKRKKVVNNGDAASDTAADVDTATIATDGDSNGHTNNVESTGIVNAQDFSFQIQWFYRPRDISKTTSDSRLLFASMHTDSCPLTSFRGLVTVRHKQDIEDEYLAKSNKKNYSRLAQNDNNKSASPSTLTSLEVYSQEPNCFYFDKLFDRYMIKFYDVLSTNNLLQYANTENTKCGNFLSALNKRFEFIFVESQRTKSLINTFSSTSRNCEVCGQWCGSSQDSISCVECENFYHMLCLDPPLLKKPSRGFSWSCASCTKKHELEYHSKKMLMLSHDNKSSNESQLTFELNALSSLDTDTMSVSSMTNPSSQEEEEIQQRSSTPTTTSILPKYETIAIEFLNKDKENSLQQRRLKEEWCMRYLGMYARLEDGVDLDDRSPYPRASTRLGAKHQATNIPECDEDHHIVYYDVERTPPRKKPGPPGKNRKNIPVNNIDELELKKLDFPQEFNNVDRKDYPSWLQPRPKGYIERGVDDGEGLTCSLLWKSSEEDINDNFTNLDNYIKKCSGIAEGLELSPNSPNFMDAIVLLYMKYKGDSESAFEEAKKLTKKILKEPVFNKEEIKRFEAGVKMFGSELHPVYKKVKTQPSAMIVRYYYLWKKTKNGRLIWGNFEGRIQKKVQNIKEESSSVKIEQQLHHPIIDDLADPEDDSSYENDKITSQLSKFKCKHCNTHSSLQWFRITGFDAKKLDEDNQIIALCNRCARLWRRYAVIWEDPLEIQRKTTKSIGWKKKVEPELLHDANVILDYADLNSSTLVYEGFGPDENELIQPQTLSDRKSNTKSVAVDKQKSESPKKKRSYSPAVTSNNNNNKVKRQAKSSVVKVKSEENIPKSVGNEVNNNKRKLSSEVTVKPEEIKKQKKQLSLADSIFNPVFNPNYKLPPLDFKSDKKSHHPILTQQVISELIHDFRRKQLVDLTSQLYNVQVPHLTSIELPFEPQDRKCCICREHDTFKSSILEMLICSCCGVNVHSSCAGISMPENTNKPIKEWLCERCINDLRPVHSTVYSCALCLANESNYELSIMGSPYVRPDFLKPTDTGKWCHLLCAVFNHELVSFRQQQPQHQTQNVPTITDSKSIIDSMNNLISVENISKIYLENHKTVCGICNTRNGSMIKCDLCSDEIKYHITCAQDSPNFKLGFKLGSKSSLVDKDIQLVNVEGKIGKLQPILICPRHDQSKSTILNMRTLGKRVHGKEELKPLFQMFLQDILKVNNNRQYGPNSRALNYITNFQIYHNSELKDKYEITEDTEHTCIDCNATTSPIWWPIKNESSKAVKCQSCYHKEKPEDSTMQEDQNGGLVEGLSRPLNGENYGIIDQYDKVSAIYQPEITKEKPPMTKFLQPVESIRSKISLGDILS
ncbi:E3 ubiquitin-protein ligase SNT2 [Spathaspora sp. JA1]|nr:E3 ubiquitin-protein ligase SNT2 [Spathaspora sp. JA1]